MCGLALVSGAAYDLEDARTFELGADPGFFAARFDDGEPGWRRRASLVPRVRAGGVVLTLSRGDRTSAPAILRWVRERACGGA